VAGWDEVPAAAATYLAAMHLPRRAAIWADLRRLDWAGAGIEVAVRAASADDAVGITGAFCAIAETGSLLCLSGPGSDASTSLLPETHLAVVPVSRLVAGMEEAFALVGAERGSLPRALNFISGPSRTGDIEQTIVLGAHGPARVHLILVNDGERLD
ncbi:MAG TPA: lactate utilization protein C, partial [Rhodocyclaceae bacterium]|nr:lactate utilization protein C [Rhodocyclaceae bacterium]